MHPIETQTVELVESGRASLDAIRASLIDLYSVVGADIDRPQKVARLFGLNRNLTWKLARVIAAESPFAALNHLPGKPGIERALAKFEAAGAPSHSLAAVRTALLQFMQVVTQHSGDRDQFELTLESMGLFNREYRIETARELAFRGNSMIWGVQCRTRLNLGIITPDGPGTVAQIQIGSVMGFTRLRPAASWRMFRLTLSNDRGDSIPNAIQPLLPTAPDDPPFILRPMCSDNVPTIQLRDGPEGCDYLLSPGTVGNLAAFDCAFGCRIGGLPRFRDDSNQFAAFATTVSAPAELLLHDLLIHRDLVPTTPPVGIVYGFPHGGSEGPEVQTPENELPCNFSIAQIDGGFPSLATARVRPFYKQAAKLLAQLNLNPDDFTAYRGQLAYPILSSRVVVRWPLPEQ